jgi:hypothetical protein
MTDIQEIFNTIKEQESSKKKSIASTSNKVENFTSIEEKEENIKVFMKNMKNDLFKIFDGSNGEIQIDPFDNISFVMEIQENSILSKEHMEITRLRGHKYTNLDAIDGEAVFVYLMNPILEHLKFSTRFLLDGRSYKNMGDNGDFKFGSKRLDIKTRQVRSSNFRSKTNLLINESTISKKFNYYGLVHREGDSSLEGKQRRCTFVGTATHEKVVENPPFIIGNGDGRKDLGKKYEVKIDELDSLSILIADVCLELFYRGGNNP